MRGICPVCNGSTRTPAKENPYKHVVAGYDSETDTFPCFNCGGQKMFGKPTGEVPLRSDGTPCRHEYEGEVRGRGYIVYTCKHRGHRYDIDSSG